MKKYAKIQTKAPDGVSEAFAGANYCLGSEYDVDVVVATCAQKRSFVGVFNNFHFRGGVFFFLFELFFDFVVHSLPLVKVLGSWEVYFFK